MEFTKLKFSVENGIASIVLNSPKTMNAFDEVLVKEALVALELCEQQDEIKVVVISGAGDNFSGGGDIGFFYRGIQTNSIDWHHLFKLAGEWAIRIKKLSKPVITAVKGAAAGAGFSTALLSDFCIAAENAKFIQSFVNVGLVPDTGSAYLLAKSVGVHKATELIMTGRVVTAQEGKELGFVYQVTSADDVEAEAMKLASKLAHGPSVAYAYMKKLMFETSFSDFEKFLESEAEYQTKLCATEDFKEGIRAFVEKRKPVFQGK